MEGQVSARSKESGREEEILRHTLGMTSNVPKTRWGFRNYFVTGPGTTDFPILESMMARGLVRLAGTINDGHDNVYRATEAGCLAIGLKPSRMKEALETDTSSRRGS